MAARAAGDRRRWHEGGSNSVVESQPSKLLVAGSIPVSRSIRLRPAMPGSGAMADVLAGAASEASDWPRPM
jgi:hypothetical protein